MTDMHGVRNETQVTVLSAESRTLPQKMHSHYHYEILYAMKGTASVTAGNTKNILTKGSVFLVHAGVVHSVTAGLGAKVVSVSFDPVHLCTLGVAFERLPVILKKAASSLCAQALFTVGTIDENIAEYCFSQCVSEANGSGYGYDIVINSSLGRLLIEMIRIWCKAGFVIDSGVSAEKLDMNSVGAYIVKHCDEQLRVEDLAAKCGMSYSYFAKRFRAVYGQTCKEYIENVRIDRAEKLLLFTSHDLSFISQELGFSDCSHLIKVFRQHKGVTPRQFRIRKGQ